MDRVLKSAEADVDAWFYCPHHPSGVVPGLAIECDCRKPQPGMIREAQRRFEIDMARSYVIGDKALDVELASRAGARGILVRTGYGEGEVARRGGTVPGAVHVAANLLEAASWILLSTGHPREPIE